MAISINDLKHSKWLVLDPMQKDNQPTCVHQQSLFLKNSPQFVTVDLGADRINFYCLTKSKKSSLMNQCNLSKCVQGMTSSPSL
ncbi:hypothetical protein O9929_04200 [Vibrio lentus]|nr:hypothetical protein [Vibrio lentus]